MATPARRQLFEAVKAALQAQPAGPDSVLVGGLVVAAAEAPLDAVVLRPHGITLLVLVPQGGRLSTPALGYGAWLLAGKPLPGAAGCDNPFEQFVQQKAALEAWLAPRLTPEQANLRFITGMVVFGAPVAFGPDVEPALNSAQANGFQLLANVADLPRRLAQLATPEIDLSAEDLAEWAALLGAVGAPPPGNTPAAVSELAEPPDPEAAAYQAAPAGAAAPANAADFLTQKARQLWGWLGAADIPDEDPPYGYDPSAAAEARREEKQQLEQLRQQMQAEVAAQLRRMEARENERERSIAQLRAELAQAPAVAPEAAQLEARLAAENREKAAQEAAMQTSQAEAAARNQQLDAKIQQLSQLIERLSVQAAAPKAAAPVGPAASGAPVSEVPMPTPAPATAPSRAAVPPVAARPAPARGAVLWAAMAASRPAWAARWAVLMAAVSLQAKCLWAWLQQGRRRRVAAGLVVGVGLITWVLSQLGADAPVPFQQDGRWGFADAKGRPVIAAQFTAAGPFQAGRAIVAKNGAYGFINDDGKEVIAPVYDALNPYAGEYARARVGDTYTFIDQQGQEFDTYYFNALDFAEGRAAVLDHRGWHYISGPTEPEKPVIFAEAYAFVDGLARVKLPDGYTYITPEYLDDPSRGTKPFGRYQLAADFAGGRARVTQNGRSFFIDKDGAEIK
ncbi:WG repeat-containing protein [Hymenobacter cheonanensis]|uniref:WG repeat-containing protein n=1 Tax=Hymenobacter sp. CA2-7 TaxID=3063993 RepID=UPI002713F6BE|nr:WG repeat-containing protein [Hymenobacter sp. CA2-7]MDO7883840.1 WG repeat-containing protein [Hymenobacter sp. CA2-7]